MAQPVNRQRALTGDRFYTACPHCSSPPTTYRFAAHPMTDAETVLAADEKIDCMGLNPNPALGPLIQKHSYSIRDGTLLALERPGWESDDMLWGFIASSEKQGLIDVQIGEVVEVYFERPFEDVYSVTLYHIPHELHRPDYGMFKMQWAVDALMAHRFVLLSSYYPDSPRSDDRASLVGWRAFGRMESDPHLPLWRELLANAHRHLLLSRWHLALLEAAFALEAFIDSLYTDELMSRGVPEKEIEEKLRGDEFRLTLSAVRDLRSNPDLTPREVNVLSERLIKEMFTPRNRLAHGKTSPAAITEAAARTAVARTQETVWDWDSAARPLLLLIHRDRSLYELRDSPNGS